MLELREIEAAWGRVSAQWHNGTKGKDPTWHVTLDARPGCIIGVVVETSPGLREDGTVPEEELPLVARACGAALLLLFPNRKLGQPGVSPWTSKQWQREEAAWFLRDGIFKFDFPHSSRSPLEEQLSAMDSVVLAWCSDLMFGQIPSCPAGCKSKWCSNGLTPQPVRFKGTGFGDKNILGVFRRFQCEARE